MAFQTHVSVDSGKFPGTFIVPNLPQIAFILRRMRVWHKVMGTLGLKMAQVPADYVYTLSISIQLSIGKPVRTAEMNYNQPMGPDFQESSYSLALSEGK